MTLKTSGMVSFFGTTASFFSSVLGASGAEEHPISASRNAGAIHANAGWCTHRHTVCHAPARRAKAWHAGCGRTAPHGFLRRFRVVLQPVLERGIPRAGIPHPGADLAAPDRRRERDPRPVLRHRIPGRHARGARASRYRHRRFRPHDRVTRGRTCPPATSWSPRRDQFHLPRRIRCRGLHLRQPQPHPDPSSSCGRPSATWPRPSSRARRSPSTC